MALAKRTNAPAFEDTDQVENVEQTMQEEVVQEVVPPATRPESKPAEQVQAQAEQTAAKALVAVKPNAVGLALKGGKLSNPFLELQNVIDVDQVRSIGVGTVPKVTADLGGAVIDKRELGKSIVIDLVSFNDRWSIHPGTDDDETVSYMRTSYDGETLENETMTAKEYLEHLKAEGFDKAAMKKYCDIWGTLESCENEGVIPEDERELVQVQLSPQSLKQWNGFQINQGLLAARGIQPTTRIKLTQERGESNSRKFGYFKFSKA